MPFVFPIMVNLKYSAAYNQILILMYAMLFRVLVGLYSCVYVAQKNAKKIAYTSISAAIINIAAAGAGKDVRKGPEDQRHLVWHAAVALYDSEMSLQAIGEELGLNPIKVRKLLITARVYESDMAEKVQATFEEYRETQDYKTSILSTANTFQLSKASVTSYLPYKKGVYFPSTEKEKISVGAERQRRYRAMKRWRSDPTEENFWGVVLVYAGVKFKTCSGFPPE